MSRRRRRGHKHRKVSERVGARTAPYLMPAPAKKARYCHKCSGKMLHRDRSAAGKHIHRLAATQPREAVMRLQIYRCPHQDGFHVGHGHKAEDPGTVARPPHPFWCDHCGEKAPFSIRGCPIEHKPGCQRRGEDADLVYRRAAEWCASTGQAIP